MVSLNLSHLLGLQAVGDTPKCTQYSHSLFIPLVCSLFPSHYEWKYRGCHKISKVILRLKTPETEYMHNIAQYYHILSFPNWGYPYDSLCILRQVHLRIRSAHPGQRDSDCVESWRGCFYWVDFRWVSIKTRGAPIVLPVFVGYGKQFSQSWKTCFMAFVPKPTL